MQITTQICISSHMVFLLFYAFMLYSQLLGLVSTSRAVPLNIATVKYLICYFPEELHILKALSNQLYALSP